MDVLEVARVRRERIRHGARFGASAFTVAEIPACERTPHPAARYAEFFAAKEAAWKAIGGSTQAEIATDEAGFPTLALTLFHTRDHAIACVVAASRGA